MSRVKKDSFKRLRQLSEVMEARILPILIHGMPAAKCILFDFYSIRPTYAIREKIIF
jgi:hypothetical protein